MNIDLDLDSTKNVPMDFYDLFDEPVKRDNDEEKEKEVPPEFNLSELFEKDLEKELEPRRLSSTNDPEFLDLMHGATPQSQSLQSECIATSFEANSSAHHANTFSGAVPQSQSLQSECIATSFEAKSSAHHANTFLGVETSTPIEVIGAECDIVEVIGAECELETEPHMEKMPEGVNFVLFEHNYARPFEVPSEHEADILVNVTSVPDIVMGERTYKIQIQEETRQNLQIQDPSYDTKTSNAVLLQDNISTVCQDVQLKTSQVLPPDDPERSRKKSDSIRSVESYEEHLETSTDSHINESKKDSRLAIKRKIKSSSSESKDEDCENKKNGKSITIRQRTKSNSSESDGNVGKFSLKSNSLNIRRSRRQIERVKSKRLYKPAFVDDFIIEPVKSKRAGRRKKSPSYNDTCASNVSTNEIMQTKSSQFGAIDVSEFKNREVRIILSDCLTDGTIDNLDVYLPRSVKKALKEKYNNTGIIPQKAESGIKSSFDSLNKGESGTTNMKSVEVTMSSNDKSEKNTCPPAGEINSNHILKKMKSNTNSNVEEPKTDPNEDLDKNLESNDKCLKKRHKSSKFSQDGEDLVDQNNTPDVQSKTERPIKCSSQVKGSSKTKTALTKKKGRKRTILYSSEDDPACVSQPVSKKAREKTLSHGPCESTCASEKKESIEDISHDGQLNSGNKKRRKRASNKDVACFMSNGNKSNIAFQKTESKINILHNKQNNLRRRSKRKGRVKSKTLISSSDSDSPCVLEQNKSSESTYPDKQCELNVKRIERNTVKNKTSRSTSSEYEHTCGKEKINDKIIIKNKDGNNPPREFRLKESKSEIKNKRPRSTSSETRHTCGKQEKKFGKIKDSNNPSSLLKKSTTITSVNVSNSEKTCGKKNGTKKEKTSLPKNEPNPLRPSDVPLFSFPDFLVKGFEKPAKKVEKKPYQNVKPTEVCENMHKPTDFQTKPLMNSSDATEDTSKSLHNRCGATLENPLKDTSMSALGNFDSPKSEIGKSSKDSTCNGGEENIQDLNKSDGTLNTLETGEGAPSIKEIPRNLDSSSSKEISDNGQNYSCEADLNNDDMICDKSFKDLSGKDASMSTLLSRDSTDLLVNSSHNNLCDVINDNSVDSLNKSDKASCKNQTLNYHCDNNVSESQCDKYFASDIPISDNCEKDTSMNALESLDSSLIDSAHQYVQTSVSAYRETKDTLDKYLVNENASERGSKNNPIVLNSSSDLEILENPAQDMLSGRLEKISQLSDSFNESTLQTIDANKNVSQNECDKDFTNISNMPISGHTGPTSTNTLEFLDSSSNLGILVEPSPRVMANEHNCQLQNSVNEPQKQRPLSPSDFLNPVHCYSPLTKVKDSGISSSAVKVTDNSSAICANLLENDYNFADLFESGDPLRDTCPEPLFQSLDEEVELEEIITPSYLNDYIAVVKNRQILLGKAGVEEKRNSVDSESDEDERFSVVSTRPHCTKRRAAARKKSYVPKCNSESDNEEQSSLDNEEQSLDNEELDDDDDDDDDPNKLWCYCQTPRLGRFMICCDRCEEWFHGECVKVTQKQGNLLTKKKRKWFCPTCKEKWKEGLPLENDTACETNCPNTKENKVIDEPINNVEKPPPSSEIAQSESKVTKSPSKATGYRILKLIKPSSQNPEKQRLNVGKNMAPEKESLTQKKPSVATKNKLPPVNGKKLQCIKEKKIYRKSINCTNCNSEAKPNSSYCSDECLEQYTERCIKNMRLSNTMEDFENQKLSVIDPLHGDVMTSEHCPTVREIVTWIKAHPSYILFPSASPSSSKEDTHRRNKTDSKKSEKTSDSKKREETSDKAIRLQDKPTRMNIRKTLKTILYERCMKSDDIKRSEDYVQDIANQIEGELKSLFENNGSKYMSKYRSLIFNIKDPKNQGLFRKILTGALTPKSLVRMSPAELASAELAKWREQENKHVLDVIKRVQLEHPIVGGSLLKKTHKGEVEIETPAEEDSHKIWALTAMDIPSLVGKKGGEETEIDAEITAKHANHIFENKCKICRGFQQDLLKNAASAKMKVAHSISVEKSLNSCVAVKKLDKHAPEKLDGWSSHENFVWKGSLGPKEGSKFFSVALKVSGKTEHFPLNLPSVLISDGRIPYARLWDYIREIKQTGSHDLVIIQFLPRNKEHQKAYDRFHSYLHSRKRYGVVPNISKKIKDFYIITLASTSPVPTLLVPFDGPGLTSKRSSLLLAVMVMHKLKPVPVHFQMPDALLRRPVLETSTSHIPGKVEIHSYKPPLPASQSISKDEDKPLDTEQDISSTSGEIPKDKQTSLPETTKSVNLAEQVKKLVNLSIEVEKEDRKVNALQQDLDVQASEDVSVPTSTSAPLDIKSIASGSGMTSFLDLPEKIRDLFNKARAKSCESGDTDNKPSQATTKISPSKILKALNIRDISVPDLKPDISAPDPTPDISVPDPKPSSPGTPSPLSSEDIDSALDPSDARIKLPVSVEDTDPSGDHSPPSSHVSLNSKKIDNLLSSKPYDPPTWNDDEPAPPGYETVDLSQTIPDLYTHVSDDSLVKSEESVKNPIPEYIPTPISQTRLPPGFSVHEPPPNFLHYPPPTVIPKYYPPPPPPVAVLPPEKPSTANNYPHQSETSNIYPHTNESTYRNLSHSSDWRSSSSINKFKKTSSRSSSDDRRRDYHGRDDRRRDDRGRNDRRHDDRDRHYRSKDKDSYHRSRH